MRTSCPSDEVGAQGSKERAGRVPAAGSAGRESAETAGKQGILVCAARPGDEHRGTALTAESASLAAARRPDVEDAVADPAPRVVDEEAAVVLPTDVDLDVSAEREQLRIGGDDTLPHQLIPTGRPLETVGRELHGHRLAGAQRLLPVDRPVSRRASHERPLEPNRRIGARCGRDLDDGGHDVDWRTPPHRMHAHGGRGSDAEQRDGATERNEGALTSAAVGRPGALAAVRRHANTSCTNWSSTGSAHPDASPAMAPMRAGSAYSTRPARAFLSSRVASTTLSTGSSRGRATGNPARRRTPSMREAVPDSATPSRSAMRASRTMPMATASPCSSA